MLIMNLKIEHGRCHVTKDGRDEYIDMRIMTKNRARLCVFGDENRRPEKCPFLATLIRGYGCTGTADDYKNGKIRIGCPIEGTFIKLTGGMVYRGVWVKW